MKKYFIILVMAIIFLCAGCAVTTLVTTPTGDIYTVRSKSDALVELAEGDKKITVDNRGRPGMVEQALGIMFMNLPDVEVKP